LNHISSAGKSAKVVLLIDELNALRSPLDGFGARFLRDEFLDKKNRYLVYTSHVLMNIDSVEQGFSSSIPATIGISSVPPSSRGYKSITLPLSYDIERLRRLPDCNALTKSEISLCGAIPSLIYSIKSLHDISLKERFDLAKLSIASENQNIVLEIFTEEIMNGAIVSNNDASRMFDSFASLHGEKLRWPLMYIGCICKLFSSSQACLSIGNLVVNLSTYAATIESGKDWEVIIAVATVLRYLWIVYRRIPTDNF
jgi:hypothetical protein